MRVVPQSLQPDDGGPLLAAGGLPVPPPPQAASSRAKVSAQPLLAARIPDVNIRAPRGVVGTETPNAGIGRRLTAIPSPPADKGQRAARLGRRTARTRPTPPPPQ